MTQNESPCSHGRGAAARRRQGRSLACSAHGCPHPPPQGAARPAVPLGCSLSARADTAGQGTSRDWPVLGPGPTSREKGRVVQSGGPGTERGAGRAGAVVRDAVGCRPLHSRGNQGASAPRCDGSGRSDLGPDPRTATARTSAHLGLLIFKCGARHTRGRVLTSAGWTAG